MWKFAPFNEWPTRESLHPPPFTLHPPPLPELTSCYSSPGALLSPPASTSSCRLWHHSHTSQGETGRGRLAEYTRHRGETGRGRLAEQTRQKRENVLGQPFMAATHEARSHSSISWLTATTVRLSQPDYHSQTFTSTLQQPDCHIHTTTARLSQPDYHSQTTTARLPQPGMSGIFRSHIFPNVNAQNSPSRTKQQLFGVSCSCAE